MSSFLFDKGREGFLGKSFDWVNDNVVALLIDTNSLASSDATALSLLSQVTGATVASASVTGKTNTSGVADADDTTFTAVTGNPCEALILYDDTVSDRLLCWIDGFSVTPNTGDITAQWDSGANKIFKL